MKLLVMGDFHGVFPVNLKKIVKEKKIELIVSVGDFFPFSYRKVWFENCYKKNVQLWEVLGKKKFKQLVDNDIKKGEILFKKLNSLGVPIMTVFGNIDYLSYADTVDIELQKWQYPGKNFLNNLLKKYSNIKRFDYSYFKFNNFVFIGAYGQTFPGKVKSKAYKKYRAKLDKLFFKFKDENKENRLIFVSHNVPYNTKLDLLSNEAHELARGKHYGSKLIRRIIDRYEPFLYFGGHIHEGFGKTKIGKTLAINSGTASKGEMVLINIDEGKRKIKKIEFLK